MNGEDIETSSTPSANLVWVITGTSSGLGRALVQTALARGDHVVATARNLDSIRHFTDDPKTSDRVYIKNLDVRAPFSELRELAGEVIEKWGRVDVLVNNAGVGMLGITEEVGVEGYRTQIDNNFFGPLNVTNAFLPYMRAQRKGTIVFVGSRSSWRTHIPMIGTYAASKAALIAMAESLAVEVAPFGIDVLKVLPGGMRTQNWKNMSLLPTSSDALLPTSASLNDTDQHQHGDTNTTTKNNNKSTTEDGHIADYVGLRNRQIELMSAVTCDGDAEKCARAIVDIVTGNSSNGWPDLGLLVLGADAEANIRSKCHAILKNLDEWQDVVRGIAIDPEE